MKFPLFLLLFLLPFLGFSQSVYTDGWTPLVPSAALPPEVDCGHANNNVDAVSYAGRYYVAFRTAPTHFASRKTKLYVISSADFDTWKYETSFALDADMREPRFAVFHDKLYFYFFEGGANMFRFEPRHIWVSIFDGTAWAGKQKTNLDGFVNWRFRTHNGKLYLSAYNGVNLYNDAHSADLRLFTSENGVDFTPISKEPQITTHGAEEGEFVFDPAGNLWATVRIEGSGSYLCYAPKDSLGRWTHKFSKHKYDSALLLAHGNEIYLLARRHLKGNATETEHPTKRQRGNNMVRYSLSRKVTALYRIDKEKMEVEHVMDFPSTGDNAFPALAPKDGSSYYLLNYSSDIHKGKKNWLRGQLGRT